MDQHQLRRLLAAVRRQWWVVLQAMVVVGAVAFVLAQRQPEAPFRATATISIKAQGDLTLYRTTDEYVQAQLTGLGRPEVADRAAAKLPGSDPQALAGAVSAQPLLAGQVAITATDPDPDVAVAIANAYAQAFLDERADRLTADERRKIADLRRKADEVEARLAQLNKDKADAAAFGVRTPAIDTQLEALGRTYQSLSDELVRLEIGINDKVGDEQLVERAVGAFQGRSTDPSRRAALGAALGLLLGLALAALREVVDDRLRTRDDLVAATDLPVLAEVPFDHAAKKGDRLAPVSRSTSGTAEGFRTLRTALGFMGADRGLRRIVVTSARAGDGKTLVAANLACAYAQAGFATVVVSCDLRRPTIDEVFGVPAGARGLADLLAASMRHPSTGRLGLQDPGPRSNGHPLHGANGAHGAHGVHGVHGASGTNGTNGTHGPDGRPEPATGPAPPSPSPSTFPAPGAAARSGLRAPERLAPPSFAAPTPRPAVTPSPVDDVVRPTKVDNLWIVPSGTLPPNPGELLGSRRLAEVLAELGRRAEVIVLDTTPTVVADAAVLASLADGVVLVAAAGQTTRSALRESIEALSGRPIRVLGVVFNKVKRTNTGGYYRNESPYPPGGGRAPGRR